MKKIISIALVLCFVLALVSCGKSGTSSFETNSGDSAESFAKPDQYASVLLITINPQFRLYLNENGNVLAIESTNKDAESIRDSIAFKNQSFETVIETIITAANENGFIKADATINFEIVESKETDTVQYEILSKAEKKANDTADELKIKIKVNIGDIRTKNDTNSSETETSDNPSPSKATNQSSSEIKPNINQSALQPTHTHSFSAATCTEPQRCLCGATQGNALGHKWNEATCKAPKTCSVCNVTEGAIKDHIFKNGKCTMCQLDDSINTKENFNINLVYKGYVLEDNSNTLITVKFWYDSEDKVYAIRQNWYYKEYYEGAETITYNGNNYYGGDGGGFPIKCIINTTSIEFRDFETEEVLGIYAMQHDKKLRLISNTNVASVELMPNIFELTN